MTYDVFTDGSCSKTADGVVSWVAWSAVVPDHQAILASGHLHGILQTNNRGELCAILSALHWKLRNSCSLRVWTDSQYCLTNFEYLKRFQTVPESWSNRDLWLEALALVLVVDWSTCTLLKVAAHADPCESDSPLQDWLIRGNDMADAVAKRTNMDRGQPFTELLVSYENRHFELAGLARSQRSFLLSISRFDLGMPLRTPNDPEDDTVFSLGRMTEPNQCLVAAALEPLIDRNEWPSTLFEAEFLSDLSAWLAGLDILASHSEPISLLELVVGFCACTEKAFPTCIALPGPRYRYPGNVALGALARPTLAASVSVMKAALELLFKLAQTDLLFEHHPRHVVNVSFPVLCLRIGVPFEISCDIRSRLAGFSSHPLRCARDIARTYQHIV